jgi:hypothetical protein
VHNKEKEKPKRLYTRDVYSCIGLVGRGSGGCPHGRWANVNCTKFHCGEHDRDVDFSYKPANTRTDKYIPTWCRLKKIV